MTGSCLPAPSPVRASTHPTTGKNSPPPSAPHVPILLPVGCVLRTHHPPHPHAPSTTPARTTHHALPDACSHNGGAEPGGIRKRTAFPRPCATVPRLSVRSNATKASARPGGREAPALGRVGRWPGALAPGGSDASAAMWQRRWPLPKRRSSAQAALLRTAPKTETPPACALKVNTPLPRPANPLIPLHPPSCPTVGGTSRPFPHPVRATRLARPPRLG